MEIGKIKFEHYVEKLQSEELFPFTSSELFGFFRFTRHSDFKRMLDQPKNYSRLIFPEDFSLVNSRSREYIRLSKEIFLSLIEKKHPQLLELFQNAYVDWKSKSLIKKLDRFGDAAKRRKGNYLTIVQSSEYAFIGKFSQIKGSYYMTSLSTDNYAFAIGIDPMSSYQTFLKWNRHSLANRFIKCETPSDWGYENDSFIKNNHQKPRARFDSDKDYERRLFLNYLKYSISEGYLTDLQIKIHSVFEKGIIDLLKKQLLNDIKYGRASANNVDIKDDLKEIKLLYRKTAVLCHPDKGGDPEIFKKLSNAYEILDFQEMKKIYNRLKK